MIAKNEVRAYLNDDIDRGMSHTILLAKAARKGGFGLWGGVKSED